MKYKIYYYKTYIDREKGYVGCTMDIKGRHSAHKTKNKGILDEPEILAKTDCILEARKLEDKYHYDLLGITNRTPYVDNRSHIYKNPIPLIKPKKHTMKFKDLNNIRLMANQLGYNTSDVTVDQMTQLYNIIKPALDNILTPAKKEAFSEEKFDNLSIDLTEI